MTFIIRINTFIYLSRSLDDNILDYYLFNYFYLLRYNVLHEESYNYNILNIVVNIINVFMPNQQFFYTLATTKYKYFSKI